MPLIAEKRQQWIENIQKHQNFTIIDEKTIRFPVCNLHFEANKIRKGNRRILAEGPPTIFPKINSAIWPRQSKPIPTPAATMSQEENTGMIPLCEPYLCLEQYKK